MAGCRPSMRYHRHWSLMLGIMDHEGTPRPSLKKMDAITLLLIATLPTGIRHEVPLGEFANMAECIEGHGRKPNTAAVGSGRAQDLVLYCAVGAQKAVRSVNASADLLA